MNTIKVDIDNLYLDPDNYRLRSHPDYLDYTDLGDDQKISKAIQSKTLRLLTGKNNFEIKDLIDSFKSNGFLKVDNILVKKIGDEKYIVIEGNRRVAALKILKKLHTDGYETGNINPDIFKSPESENDDKGIEVVEYDYENEEDYLILMGLRHVSGNKKWDKYNQAKLIAELHEKGNSINSIANRLGLRSSRIAQQQLDAYYAIKNYISNKEAYDADSNFNPHEKFMIFVEVLLKRNVKNWLEWDEEGKEFKNKSNLNRFYSWISPEINSNALTEDDEDNDDDIILLDPIIKNHKEIRDLNEIIDDEDSLEILESSRDIREASEQNTGYTKKKFLDELKKAEKIFKNIKLGPSLLITNEESAILNNISKMISRLQVSKNDN